MEGDESEQEAKNDERERGKGTNNKVLEKCHSETPYFACNIKTKQIKRTENIKTSWITKSRMPMHGLTKPKLALIVTGEYQSVKGG